METAKVDIRKLQLLNDRIAQVAEALNQVRLSVHGLSQAGAFGQTGAYGIGAQGLSPLGSSLPGLSHTSSFGNPAGFANPAGFVNPAFAGVPGMIQPPFSPYAGINPYAGVNPYAGLSHTSAEGIDPLGRPIASDPFMAQRLAQTFPYAYAPYALPQVVSLA